MNFHHLLYFKAIAQANSISLASEQLYLTQQSLSKSMKAFESELGTTLFTRSKQGIMLTEDGEYVLEIANKVLDLSHELEQHFSNKSSSNISGSLKIMMPNTIYGTFSAKYISKFHQNYSNIKTTISMSDDKVLLSALLHNEVDLGFLFPIYLNDAPLVDFHQSLEFTPFTKFYFSAVVSKMSPLAKLASVSLQQLSKYPIVISATTHAENSFLHQLFCQFGAETFYTAANSTIFYQLIQDNLGVSILPNSPMNTLQTSNDYVYIPIKNNLYTYLGYISNKDQVNNPCTKLFLNEFFT